MENEVDVCVINANGKKNFKSKFEEKEGRIKIELPNDLELNDGDCITLDFLKTWIDFNIKK